MLALRSENEKLKEQVTALTAEKDSLTEIGADEIEQLGTRIDELTAENTALSEKAENADNALKNENAQLKNKVDELKAETKRSELQAKMPILHRLRTRRLNQGWQNLQKRTDTQRNCLKS